MIVTQACLVGDERIWITRVRTSTGEQVVFRGRVEPQRARELAETFFQIQRSYRKGGSFAPATAW